MPTIQALPDLVIIDILRNAVEEVTEAEDLISNLPYLAICQRWRHLALPMVYNNMVMRYNFVSSENEDRKRKFMSNISLLTNIKCNLMVKRIYIHWIDYQFKGSLYVLMNVIAMNKMAWPKDISSHLIGDTSDGRHNFNPQKLNAKMYEKMSVIIENFRDAFPNIKEIKFDIDVPCDVASQFISKFVDVYSDQLTKLENLSDVLLDLPCFPPNLKYLDYNCGSSSFLLMPKINTLPLRVLKLHGIPNDFSWKQCCSSLTFPNLKILDVGSLNDGFQSIREDYAHNHGIQLDIPDSQQEQLELPVIRKLDFNPNQTSINKLNIKKLPQHLYKLIYDGCFEGFEHISKLPIGSINVVDIGIQNDVNDIDKFYKVTNRLLGKDIKNNASTTFKYFCEAPPVIDFQKTRWENITDMYFDYLDSTVLVKAIAAMPQLNKLHISIWIYIDEEPDWSSVANSKIQELAISSLEYDGFWENPTNYIVQLFKSLKYLRKAWIREELRGVLLPKLKEAKNEYQHLQGLGIIYL